MLQKTTFLTITCDKPKKERFRVKKRTYSLKKVQKDATKVKNKKYLFLNLNCSNI